MKALLAALILLPAVALAQGASTSRPGEWTPTTNYCEYSNKISTSGVLNGAWVASFATVTEVAGFDGVSNWTSVTSTGAAGYIYQLRGPNSAIFTASATAKKSSGSGYAAIWVYCGGGVPSTCRCFRSDGGSCTAATVATNFCSAEVANLTTVPVRITASVVCSAAGSSGIVLVPGQYNVAIGTTLFGGAQIEARGPPAGRLCKTPGAASRVCR